MWVTSEEDYHPSAQEGELKKKIKQCYILGQFHRTNKAHKWA